MYFNGTKNANGFITAYLRLSAGAVRMLSVRGAISEVTTASLEVKVSQGRAAGLRSGGSADAFRHTPQIVSG